MQVFVTSGVSMKQAKTYLDIKVIEGRSSKQHAEFVLKLRKWQEDSSLQYQDIADGMGITVQTLSYFINGSRSTYNTKLIKYYLENEMSKFYTENKSLTLKSNTTILDEARLLLPIGVNR